MKKTIFIFTVLCVWFLTPKVQGQGDVFSAKFPELKSSLKPDGSVEVNPGNVKLFRGQFQKLGESYEEIVKYEHGGATPENLVIFEFKELKGLAKENKLGSLKSSIKTNRYDIKKLLSDKTKYGVDSIECLEQLSIFKTLMKQKDYDNAYKSWRLLFTFYPISNKIIYSKGEKLLKTRIKKSQNNAAKASKEKNNEKVLLAVAERQSWIDTLLIMYDQRIKYFGTDKRYTAGYLTGKKGTAYFNYRFKKALTKEEKDKRKENLDTAYRLLKKSVNSERNNSKIFSTVQIFYFASDLMYKTKQSNAASVVDDYILSIDILNGIVKSNEDLIKKELKRKKPKLKKNKNRQKLIDKCVGIIDNINKKFAKGEYATCEVLVPTYELKFEENKANIEWLKKTTDLLTDKDCTDSLLYEKAVVALYDLEPSASAAYKIAKLYLKKEKYEEASGFYEKAYTQETDTIKQAKYYYEAALVASALKKVSDSYKLALEAKKLRDDYGDVYVLIAQLYIQGISSCGKDNFEKSWVYWAAVDKLNQAKAKDPSVSEKANKFISKYSKHYPRKETAFMHGITPGMNVKVGCWIQVSTKARFKK